MSVAHTSLGTSPIIAMRRCGLGDAQTSYLGMKILLFALLLGIATPLAAQSRAIAPSPSRLFALESAVPRATASTDTVPKPVRDHRWTGLAIGTVVGGAI